ncbi:MAG: ABC transporter permease [Acidobacteria bacterium]|nr:ABC transporter permease [Acidobacteriota bacterium]MCI0719390.1 ABC transporter permease [Acidobacteriota bacterium]
MMTFLRQEIFKLLRSKLLYLSFVMLVIFVLLMLWGFYTYSLRKTGGQVEFKYTYENPSYFNGLIFTLYSAYFAFQLIIPISVSILAGTQIAGEARSGTLRSLLTRPISRSRLYFGKYLVSALSTFSLLAFFIVFNLLVGLLLVGWGDLSLYPGPLNLVQEPARLPQSEALLRFCYSVFTGTWSLLTLATLAFLMSVLFENPIVASFTALTLYVMLNVIGRVDFFVDLKPYLFTTDMEFWREVFKPEIPLNELLYRACRCGMYSAAFLLAGLVVFERKDILS